jgi:hypothetical protein
MFDPAAETMPHGELAALQLAQLEASVARAHERVAPLRGYSVARLIGSSRGPYVRTWREETCERGTRRPVLDPEQA